MPSDDSSRSGETAPPWAQRQLANVSRALREDEHPTQIGPYRVVGVVGEGGMGTVYKARQLEPIERTVAVKIIRVGMDTRAVLERFESERRALSLMDHPNVARVLDAGTTPSGRPYFVMEFVDGVPITTYADDHRLSVRERLLLVAQACAAVQHAHQKAIIHRDLKPTNILVTERDGASVVKVIDFGVAKAIEQTATQATVFTDFGQLIGTPEYMSPEQAAGERDVDTRTDVYSLGVVMYELLSGALPFDSQTLRRAGFLEICRIIRDVEPPRPSARITTAVDRGTHIAKRRQSSPATLAQQLRSELDWIVIKSLQKDRGTRYASPQELAGDIENYLANRPLLAGPESIVYRARKFVRRNKAGVVVAAVAAIMLAAGVAATGWQAVRATRAERAIRAEQARTLAAKNLADAARREAETANAATAQVNGFLVDMLESVDPEIAQGKPVMMRDLIDRASLGVDRKFVGQPDVEAAVRTALGKSYAGLGLYAQADEHLAAAWHLYEKADGADARSALEAKQRYASLKTSQDKLDDAFVLSTQVHHAAVAAFGEDDPIAIDAKAELAVIADHRGDAATAERLHRETIAAYERLGQSNTEDYFVAVGNLGQLLRLNGDLAAADPLCQKAYAGVADLKGADDPTAVTMLGTYADILRLEGKLDEAEARMREYCDRANRVFGVDHTNSITAEQGLAIVLDLEGKTDEAKKKDSLEHYRSALERSRKALGDAHRDTLAQVMTFAASRYNNGDSEESTRLFREAYEGWSKTAGPDHPQAVMALFGLVTNLMQSERWDDAIEPAKTLYDVLQDPQRVQLPPGRRARYLSAYGLALSRTANAAQAINPLIAAYRAHVADTVHPRVNVELYQRLVTALADLEAARGHTDAEAWWRAEVERFGPRMSPATRAAEPSTRPRQGG